MNNVGTYERRYVMHVGVCMQVTDACRVCVIAATHSNVYTAYGFCTEECMEPSPDLTQRV